MSDASKLFQHIFRERNELADSLANKVRTKGNIAEAYVHEPDKTHLVAMFDGSALTDKWGSGCLLFQMPPTSGTVPFEPEKQQLLTWSGLSGENGNSLLAEIIAALLSVLHIVCVRRARIVALPVTLEFNLHDAREPFSVASLILDKIADLL